MRYSNFHQHTTFSDGADTPEEMIEKAKELGFVSLGFSDHSETLCDTSYCMATSDYPTYRQKIRSLAEGEEGKACHFKALLAKGNADDGDAKQETEEEPA